MNARTERRLSRRMRFRSRSVAVSIALAIVAVVAAYVGVEAVTAALGAPALLIAPADVLTAIEAGTPWSLATIAVLAILGVWSIVLACTPGGRARRELSDERAVVIIDDDVMASGLSRAAALGTGVSRDQVTTTVGRRRAVVRVRPSAGYPINADSATDAATRAVAAVTPRRPLTVRTAVDPQGVLA